MADTSSGRSSKATTTGTTPAQTEAPKTSDVKPTGTNDGGQVASNFPPEALANSANPQGDPNVKTGLVGTSEVIEGQEHVLGDDPRRVAHKSGYHDSLSGKSVDESGNFTDADMAGQGPIPPHRIVSDNWPTEREAIRDNTEREGNTASSK